ncbi:MAG: hypothetical protein ACK40O_01015 [Allosphingosinicella sp.]
MKYCQEHWDALVAAVQARGMWHLVAQGGEAAAEAMVRELEGRAAPGDWDPLMSAHWAIAGRVGDNLANSQGPGAALAAIGDPNWCPLCAVQQSFDWWEAPGRGPRPPGARDAQGWIDGCMDAMLEHARKLGLVQRVQ